MTDNSPWRDIPRRSHFRIPPPPVLHPVFPLPEFDPEPMTHVTLPGDYLHRPGREVTHTVHAYTLSPVLGCSGQPTGTWVGDRMDYMSGTRAWADTPEEAASELRAMARLEAELASHKAGQR